MAKIKKKPAKGLSKSKEPTPIYLAGDFPRNAYILPSSTSTLIISMGYVGEDRIAAFLPYVETKIAGISQEVFSEGDVQEDQWETLLSKIVPLDNGLFILSDLAEDYSNACKHFASLGDEVISADAARISLALDAAKELQLSAERCVGILEELVEGR